MPSGWPPRCGPPWHPGGSRPAPMSITAALSWMRGCCAPAPSWVSSWSTVSPEGQKGKGFLVELTEERAARIPDLAELNKLFIAWVETVYHVRVHSETGQPPLARWEAGGPFPLPAAEDLAEAFRWSEWRTVSKTALVSLHGNRYQVDPALARRRVELAFDPLRGTPRNGSYGQPRVMRRATERAAF